MHGREILEQVQKEFFDGTPFFISENVQGHSFDDDRNYVLGCRAASQASVCNLFHEMGHLAEREIDKLKLRRFGWGYYSGKPWRVGTAYGWEPENDKSVLREARCFAYQLSLQRHYNISDAKDGEDWSLDLAELGVYLPAWCYYKHRVIPKEERDGMDYKESEKLAIQKYAEEIEHLSKTEFTFERFCDAWWQRAEALKQV